MKHARDVARALPGSCRACRPSDPEGRRDGESTNRRAQNQAQAHGEAEAQADTAPAEADPQLRAFARARGRLADRHRRGRGCPRRSAPSPARKDLRQSWWRIQDQGSTGSCVGWAAADGVLRWHFVKTGRIATNELLSPRFQWIAAKETDAFNTRPTTFVEAEGTSLRRPSTSRASSAPSRTPSSRSSGAPVSGKREDLLRDRGAAQDQHVLQPRPRARELADVAGDEGADPDPAQRRLDVGEGDGDQREARAVPAADGQGRTRRDAGRLHAGDVHRPEQLGHGWGDRGFAHASLGYAQAAFTEAYGIEP